jgi:hypothetical protein
MSLIGIFSAGRTGSTIFSRMIDKLDNTYVHPAEISFLSVYDDLNSIYSPNFRKTHYASKLKKKLDLRERYSSRYLYKYYKKDLDLINKNYLKYSLSKNNLNYKDLFKKDKVNPISFVSNYLKTCSNSFIGINNPDDIIFRSIEVSFLENYRILFPEMKFIHLIRDPFDAYRSLVISSRVKNLNVNKTSFNLGGDNLEIFIERRMKLHFEYLNKYDNQPDFEKNNLIINHKDLLDNTHFELLKVGKFLGKKISNNFDKFSIFKNFKLDKLPKNISGIDFQKKQPNLDPYLVKNLKDIYNYSHDIETREKKLIYLILKKYMEKYNFSKVSTYKNKLSLILDNLKISRWEFKNLINKKNSLLKNIYNVLFFIPFIFRRRLKLFTYFKYFETNKKNI